MTRKTPTYKIPSYIRTHFNQLTHTDKLFYLYLLDLCDENDKCVYSLRELRRKTGIAASTLWRSVPTLHEAGLINAEKRPHPNRGNEVWHITLLPIDAEKLALEEQQDKKRKTKTKTEVRELKAVEMQLERTRQAGLPSTLLLGEWLTTLEHFDWKCAYCGSEYQLIEHFIPLVLGGGTTKSNCVPACSACNNRKSGYHPLLMPFSTGMGEGIQRVSQYLEARREEAAS